jgi:hypothetical protein
MILFGNGIPISNPVVLVTDVVTEQKQTSFNEKLTSEFRNIILNLKAYYNSQNILHNGLSTQIYYAVIDHNVRNADDFEKYLKKINWELK